MKKTILLLVGSCAMAVPALHAVKGEKGEEEVTYTSFNDFREEEPALPRGKKNRKSRTIFTLRSFRKKTPKKKDLGGSGRENSEDLGTNGIIGRERANTYWGQTDVYSILPADLTDQNSGTSQALWDTLWKLDQHNTDKKSVQYPCQLQILKNEKNKILNDLSSYQQHIDCCNDRGWTPLIFAINQVEDYELTNQLLGMGADPNIPTQGRTWSPLHFAVSNTMLSVVEKLLQRGADPCVQNSEGNTPHSLISSVDSPNKAELQQIGRLLLKAEKKQIRKKQNF